MSISGITTQCHDLLQLQGTRVGMNHLEEVFGALNLEVLVLVLAHFDVDVLPSVFNVHQALEQVQMCSR